MIFDACVGQRMDAQNFGTPRQKYLDSSTTELKLLIKILLFRWVIVSPDVRASPPLLKSPYGVGTWKVHNMGKAFRFIRLRSTGVNGRLVQDTTICSSVPIFFL